MSNPDLIHAIDEKFDRPELILLCADLGLPREEIMIGEKGKLENVINLVEHCQRHGRMKDLIAYCRRKRPNFPQFTEMDERGVTAAQQAAWDEGLKTYYDRLKKQIGFVRILGRSNVEPLENVFTHVNVMDRITAEKRHGIDRLVVEAHPRDFERLGRTKRVAGDEAVATYSKLFVLGKPGAGKTTFLKHTALRAINGEIDKIPIFVTLKELSDGGMEIFPFMVRQFKMHQFPNPELFVKHKLQNGEAIVLFDGLDEVNLEDEKRSKLIDALNEFVNQFSYCLYLLSCRVAATDYSFTQFEYVEMADFDRKQINGYIGRWFVKDKEKGNRCRHDLLQNKENETVRELAQTPLLLSLLCLVYEELNKFPPERHELYEEAARALLAKWDDSRKINRDIMYKQLSLGRKQKMLASIAAQNFEEGQYFIKEQQLAGQIESYLQRVPNVKEPDGELVLKAMAAQHGIFVERARGIYSFSHLTLQEYFMAKYIVDNEARGAVERMMVHVTKDNWNEVFLLTASMIDDAKNFCNLYLLQIRKLLGEDAQLATIFQWANYKSAHLQLFYKPAEARAFLIREAIRRVPNYDNLTLDDIHTSASSIAFDIDSDISEIESSIEHTNVFDGYIYLLSDSSLKNASIQFFTEINSKLLVYVPQLAHKLHLTDLANALTKLNIPDPDAPYESWYIFARKFESLLEQYRDQWDIFTKFHVDDEEIKMFMNLPDELVNKLVSILDACFIFVRCLKVAVLSKEERQGFEGQILYFPAPDAGD